jgi:hypothetical protein
MNVESENTQSKEQFKERNSAKMVSADMNTQDTPLQSSDKKCDDSEGNESIESFGQKSKLKLLRMMTVILLTHVPSFC